MPNVFIDEGTKIQALALAYAGHPHREIAHITGMNVSTIKRLMIKAESRGYDPTINPALKIEHVVDSPRSGRPRVGGKKAAAQVSVQSEPIRKTSSKNLMASKSELGETQDGLSSQDTPMDVQEDDGAPIQNQSMDAVYADDGDGEATA